MAALGEKEWREHATLVGSVTLSWNHNVHQLLRVFIHLTGIESPLADAIFFSHQSDKSQRHLIQRVAKAVGLSDTDSKALEKLLKRLDTAAPGRNLAAHTIFGVTAFDPVDGTWGPKVVPALLPPQDLRLEQNFTAQFRKIDSQLRAIYSDLEEWLKHTPYPARPWGSPPFPSALTVYAEPASAEDLGSL